MKTTLYLLVALIPSFVFAQNELVIEEGNAPMPYGMKASYSLVIPQAKLKDVTESFKKYIRTGTKAKIAEENGIISIVGAVNSNISALPINVFGKLTEMIKGISVTLWVSEGEIFISQEVSPSKNEAVKKYLHDFAVQEYRNAVQNELKAEQDKAKEAQRLLDGFVRDYKKAETAISDHKAEIALREKKIKEEETNAANAVASQAQQKAVVDGLAATVAAIQEKLNNIK